MRSSPMPSAWRICHLPRARVVMGGFDLVFSITCFAVGKFALCLDISPLRT